MKKSSQFLLFAAMLVAFGFACQNASHETAENEVVKREVLAENKASVDMKVGGMVCAMGCAKFIQDKVAELDGVVLSEVDFENESAHFEFDKTSTSPEEIEKYINEIHDGQYSANIASAEEIEADEPVDQEEVDQEETIEEKKSLESVSGSVNFTFPELFTYFLRRI